MNQKKEKRSNTYNILPCSPYFHCNSIGDVKVGLNGLSFPKIDHIQKCIDALEDLKKTPKEEIDEYTRQAELACAITYDGRLNVKKPIEGYVYIYQQDKYYKIGRSKTEDCREKKYITENPLPIKLVLKKKVHDYIGTESTLHMLFEHKKFNREWFYLDKKDLRDIKIILKQII